MSPGRKRGEGGWRRGTFREIFPVAKNSLLEINLFAGI
jgi:hypothetical protein